MKISTKLFSLVIAICCFSISVNADEAFDTTRKAAEQGDIDAQLLLARIYFEGNGVRQDFAAVVEWINKVEEQEGMLLALGRMYYKGDGVPQDDTEAVKWIREAAEQGNAFAQLNLGGIYSDGDDVSQDDAEAAKWYRKAAEQGNAIAQWFLGMTYAEGDGVPQDDVEAYMWFNLSIYNSSLSPGHLDSPLSEEWIDELLLKMSKEQIAEGDAMTRKWIEDEEQIAKGRAMTRKWLEEFEKKNAGKN
ncbi:MAG: tetratricopeptide repeat protein [Candidatus Hydrogenedentota bacterium]